MAKIQITVEDNETGVSISVDNHAELHGTAAGRVVGAMMQGAKLVGRIPLPVASAEAGCDCDACEAYRELLQTKPTIH
ncbi:hypothetical protein OGV25_16200 [Pseudomonas sp. P1B16]|uniref:hypothetical protein n=1 Tax=Pseudomonas sp. P1B16 TaxID=2986074 RepID=UPI002A24A309|nr:hypothetical protein [Pseudomonas sp. P1B16]WPM24866.1 hypothetical protein OGV25_16200 [Pseudomonas sp. P1B16]